MQGEHIAGYFLAVDGDAFEVGILHGEGHIALVNAAVCDAGDLGSQGVDDQAVGACEAGVALVVHDLGIDDVPAVSIQLHGTGIYRPSGPCQLLRCHGLADDQIGNLLHATVVVSSFNDRLLMSIEEQAEGNGVKQLRPEIISDPDADIGRGGVGNPIDRDGQGGGVSGPVLDHDGLGSLSRMQGEYIAGHFHAVDRDGSNVPVRNREGHIAFVNAAIDDAGDAGCGGIEHQAVGACVADVTCVVHDLCVDNVLAVRLQLHGVGIGLPGGGFQLLHGDGFAADEDVLAVDATAGVGGGDLCVNGLAEEQAEGDGVEELPPGVSFNLHLHLGGSDVSNAGHSDLLVCRDVCDGVNAVHGGQLHIVCKDLHAVAVVAFADGHPELKAGKMLQLHGVLGGNRVALGILGQGNGVILPGGRGVAAQNRTDLLLVHRDGQHTVDIGGGFQENALIPGNFAVTGHNVGIPVAQAALGAVGGNGDTAHRQAILIPLHIAQLQNALAAAGNGLSGHILTVKVDGKLRIQLGNDVVDQNQIVCAAGISGLILGVDGDGLLIDCTVEHHIDSKVSALDDGGTAVKVNRCGNLIGCIGHALHQYMDDGACLTDTGDGNGTGKEGTGLGAADLQLGRLRVHPEGVLGGGFVAVFIGNKKLQHMNALIQPGKGQRRSRILSQLQLTGDGAVVQLPDHMGRLVSGQIDGNLPGGVDIPVEGFAVIAVLLQLFSVEAGHGHLGRIGLHHGYRVGVGAFGIDDLIIFGDRIGVNPNAVQNAGFQTGFPAQNADRCPFLLGHGCIGGIGDRLNRNVLLLLLRHGLICFIGNVGIVLRGVADEIGGSIMSAHRQGRRVRRKLLLGKICLDPGAAAVGRLLNDGGIAGEGQIAGFLHIHIDAVVTAQADIGDSGRAGLKRVDIGPPGGGFLHFAYIALLILGDDLDGILAGGNGVGEGNPGRAGGDDIGVLRVIQRIHGAVGCDGCDGQLVEVGKLAAGPGDDAIAGVEGNGFHICQAGQAVEHQLAGFGGGKLPCRLKVLSVGEGNGDAGLLRFLVVVEQRVGAVRLFGIQNAGHIQPLKLVGMTVRAADQGQAVVEGAAHGNGPGLLQGVGGIDHRQRQIAVVVITQGEGVVHSVGGTDDGGLGVVQAGHCAQKLHTGLGACHLGDVGAKGQDHRLAGGQLAHLGAQQRGAGDIVLAHGELHIAAVVVAHTKVHLQNMQRAVNTLQVNANIYAGQLDHADKGDIGRFHRGGSHGLEEHLVCLGVLLQKEVAAALDERQHIHLDIGRCLEFG